MDWWLGGLMDWWIGGPMGWWIDRSPLHSRTPDGPGGAGGLTYLFIYLLIDLLL